MENHTAKQYNKLYATIRERLINVELTPFFKSVVDQEPYGILICGLDHTILYMNPAADRQFAKRGGTEALLGHSLMDCHSALSQEKILQVLDWFRESPDHNCVFTFYKAKENRDTYMVALRNQAGQLIGYYEKHCFRTRETAAPYQFEV